MHSPSGFLLLADYCGSRKLFFPSPTSMEWFVRKHRRALVESGALFMVAGRWLASATEFDAFVIQQGKVAASASIEVNAQRG